MCGRVIFADSQFHIRGGAERNLQQVADPPTIGPHKIRIHHLLSAIQHPLHGKDANYSTAQAQGCA